MRIAMMGSGGIGGYVGARLSQAGEDIHFIARGAHLAAMQRNGLRVLSPFGDVHLERVNATENPAEVGPVDLVIFAVKLWDTDDAARRLVPLLTPETRVLTLQNGVDSRDGLRRYIPPAQIVTGVTYISAHIGEPGLIRSPGGPRSVLADRTGDSPVITALVEVGSRAIGLDIETTDDIDSTLWTKLIRLAAFSAATTVMRLRIGTILEHPEARSLLRQLVDEGVSVATAQGHRIDPNFADLTMAFYGTLSPLARSSMAEDIEHGRRLEVEYISGRIHKLGRQLGIATPAHTMAYQALAPHADGTPPVGS